MRRRGLTVRAATVLSTGALLLSCSDGAGDGEDARSGHDAAPAAAPDGDAGPLQQGLDAHAAGDLTEAEGLYRQAVEEDDGRAYAYYNLGLVEQTTGRPVEAERHYRQALALDPNLSSAQFNLAILRTQAEAFDEALQLYERVVTLEPGNAAAHLNLGVLLTQLGQNDRALRALSTAVDLDPALAERLATAEPANAAPRGSNRGTPTTVAGD